MGYGKLLISLMFFLASFVYIFWGIYVIRANPKEGLNRAFFALSVSLSIWSFGYAMTNLSLDLEAALFWRRIGSAGRMHLFSLVLHFIILLTYGKNKLDKKWFLILLHIPAILLIYVFSISANMAPLQYNLIQIDYGWLDKPVENIWNKIYYLYFVTYMLITLGLVMIWKKKIRNKKTIKQANLIFKTIAIAILFGGFLDILPNIILSKPVPQLSSVFILLPLGAMYRAARYHDLFKIENLKKEEVIVTEEDRKKIFNNLSIGYYIAAILFFISEYIPHMNKENSFKHALAKGLSLASIGIIISLIQKIKEESVKENLTILVLVSSIPIGILQYLKYGGLTVWAFPMVLIISSTIFSKLSLLISTLVISISTQILIWILRPEVTVVVNKYDYILRIGMFIVAFFIGLYINKIYTGKIKENKYQIKFQKMVSDISFDFLSLNGDNSDTKVNNLLENIGSFFNVDRTYLFTINHKNNTMTYSNEWCNVGICEEVGTIEEVSLDVFPWWIDQLNNKNLVYIADVDFMPKEASEEQGQLHRQKVKSLVSVPVIGEGIMQGFIGIDSVLENKQWSEEKIKMLNIMANILSSGIIQIKADKEIEFMAYYDNLTKLPNRFLFADRVNQAIHLSKRTGKFISVIFIDLDDFKLVNDTIGHGGGDVLLKQVAKSLGEVIRKTDSISRFGGDEFMIMINNLTDHDGITKIADKIMKVFSNPFTVNNQEFLVTASAGIAMYPEDGVDSDTLAKNADIAMYKAKSKGKNQYVICTEEMKAYVQMSMKLSNELSGALERNELFLYYQPQINLLTKEITGVEALIRWFHPTRGIISPGVFIPLAEKNNLINSIGQWVLKAACLQNKKWQDMGLEPINVAINLSTIEIMNPNIVENIENIIKETGLDPKYIELEITESIAIKEKEYVIDVLNKLKKIGVSIAIDDFGTEYSSLSRLKILPIDRIKIDMQFVQGIENSGKDKEIIMVIINLAKSLDLNVLAEGVETDGQLKFLNQKMCDYVQGYYYYKPMPAKEMEKILIDLYKEEAEKWQKKKMF